MSNPQNTQELLEYLLGQNMATTQALIGTLRYIKRHIPNGSEITQVISTYLDLHLNHIQRLELPPLRKDGVKDHVEYIQEEIKKALNSP